MNRYWILLVLVFFDCGAAAAQNITLQGRLVDGRTTVPVGGAVVEIFSLTDTITYRTTTGVDGVFRIHLIRSIGKYALLAQKTGYADYLKVIEIKGLAEDLGKIVMVDSSRLLKETEVKAKRSAFTVRGDTVEYSSSYYKTNPDMDAVYLLNKMPGIDLGAMRANGDTVTGVAINGLVIFGGRPRQILAQLPAGLIEKVQVYTDSLSTVERGAGRVRTKIINVKTTDGALHRPKGKALAGAGTGGVFNNTANAIRQRGGAQMSMDAGVTRGGIRNALYYDPTYPFEVTGVPLVGRLSFNTTQPLSTRDNLGVDYSVNAHRNQVVRTTLDQFGLGRPESSFIRTLTDGTQEHLNNDVRIRWVRTTARTAKLQAASFARSGHSRANEAADVVTSIEGTRSESHSDSRTKTSDLSAGGWINYSTDARKAASYSAGVSYSLSATNGRSTVSGYNRNDSVTVPTDFRTIYTRHTHNFGVNLGGKRTLSSPQHTLACAISGSYNAHRADQRRDLYSGTTDDYSIKDKLLSTQAHYSTLNNYAEAKDVWTLDSDEVTLETGAGVRYFGLWERAGTFSKTYFTLNPFLRFSKRYSTQKELAMQLEKLNEMPAYDDLNPLLIAKTAFFYHVGNLALRPSQRFNLNGSYRGRFLLKESVFNASAGLTYIRNNIVQSLIVPVASAYFFEGKPIPVGARLQYVQNAGESRYIYSGFGVDAPLAGLKTVVKFKTRADVRSTDAALNDTLVSTTSYNYNASTTFSSTLSTRFDAVMYVAYYFNRTMQHGEGATASRDVHRLLLNALVTAQVDKRQTLKAEANVNTTSGLFTTQPTRYFLLDLSYNIKVLQARKLSLGATLHDALNSYRAFGFEYNPFISPYPPNGIYSYETNAVGRYLLATASYTF